MNHKKREIDVIILVGGLGTRLKSVVSDRPKCLAKIGEITFLDCILDNLYGWGFRNIILSVGYMRDKIYDHIKKNHYQKKMVINFSEEENPLGTGGAIKKSLKLSNTKKTMILNGDTYFNIDYDLFLKKHNQSKADVSIALRHVDDTSSSGKVSIDSQNRVLSFNEKEKRSEGGTINGGVYIFERGVLEKLKFPESFSIEKDFFEKMVDRVPIYGFVFPDYFVDIGTPETYASAEKYLKLRPLPLNNNS